MDWFVAWLTIHPVLVKAFSSFIVAILITLLLFELMRRTSIHAIEAELEAENARRIREWSHDQKKLQEREFHILNKDRDDRLR